MKLRCDWCGVINEEGLPEGCRCPECPKGLLFKAASELEAGGKA